MKFMEDKKQLIMSDCMIKRNVINQVAESEGLDLSELEKLIELDGLEKDFVHILKCEQHNLLNVGNLWNFSGLTEVHLANNFIEEIDNLEFLSNLQFLDLSFNYIKSIKGLNDLISLKFLNISYNKIEVLKNMDSLKKLETFLVRGNKIKSIEDVLYLKQFKGLFSLGIGENPFALESNVKFKIIAMLPQLKLLDFKIVSKQELLTAVKNYPMFKNPNFPQEMNSENNIDDSSPCFKKSFSDKEAFVDNLADGQGLKNLLENDKNFNVLLSFPPVFEIADNYCTEVSKIFDGWHKTGVDYYHKMLEEEKEFLSAVNKAENFAHDISQEEEYKYTNFKENLPKDLCLILQKNITSEQKDEEVRELKEKCGTALSNVNKNLMNASCLCHDLVYKLSKVFEQEMLKVKTNYLQDVERSYDKIMKADETCTKELMTFYANVIENGQSSEISPELSMLLRKKEYVETALQLSLKLHSALLQEKIKKLTSSLHKLVTETFDTAVKMKFFVKRSEELRDIDIFCNKQHFVMGAFFNAIPSFKQCIGCR